VCKHIQVLPRVCLMDSLNCMQQKASLGKSWCLPLICQEYIHSVLWPFHQCSQFNSPQQLWWSHFLLHEICLLYIVRKRSRKAWKERPFQSGMLFPHIFYGCLHLPGFTKACCHSGRAIYLVSRFVSILSFCLSSTCSLPFLFHVNVVMFISSALKKFLKTPLWILIWGVWLQLQCSCSHHLNIQWTSSMVMCSIDTKVNVPWGLNWVLRVWLVICRVWRELLSPILLITSSLSSTTTKEVLPYRYDFLLVASVDIIENHVCRVEPVPSLKQRCCRDYKCEMSKHEELCLFW
jgi:hypothetical protein